MINSLEIRFAEVWIQDIDHICNTYDLNLISCAIFLNVCAILLIRDPVCPTFSERQVILYFSGFSLQPEVGINSENQRVQPSMLLLVMCMLKSLFGSLRPVICLGDVLAQMRACWTLHSTSTLLCPCNATRVMATASTLNQFEMSPHVGGQQKLCILLLLARLILVTDRGN